MIDGVRFLDPTFSEWCDEAPQPRNYLPIIFVPPFVSHVLFRRFDSPSMRFVRRVNATDFFSYTAVRVVVLLGE